MSDQQHNQWLRKAEIILAGGDTAYSLTESFRFTFNTTQRDAQTFNTARVRIYNLSDKTVQALLGKTGVEYTKLIVNVGYQPPGNFGTIFQGTIAQFSYGRETNVNSYLDIFAADGDILNFHVVSGTLEGPTTQQDQIAAITTQLQESGITYNGINEAQQVGGILPRGKVLFGNGMSILRQLGKQRLSTWTVINGVLTEIPLTGYLPGEVVVINSQTGLIGTPETTQQGLTLTCLLNPRIFVGQRIKLNNKEINQTIVKDRTADLSTALNLFASESADGIYRVCVHEFEGDTRGNSWYSHIVALSIDPSAPPNNSVSLYGGTGAGEQG